MGIPKITEMAINNALFGGGGGKREGTAIPVGQHVDRIYFNTELPVEETNALLSQLTYVQTPLSEMPLCGIYVNTENGIYGQFIVAIKGNDESYSIECIVNLQLGVGATLYDSKFTVDRSSYNGWGYTDSIGSASLTCVLHSLRADGASIADFNGIPVGAENEKIKNVLSITPF